MKLRFLRCELLHHFVLAVLWISCSSLSDDIEHDPARNMTGPAKSWTPRTKVLGPFQTYVDFSKHYSCTTWFQMSQIKVQSM